MGQEHSTDIHTKHHRTPCHHCAHIYCLCHLHCVLQSSSTHLDADDPRRVWEERNRKALRDREQSEAAKKVEVLSKAKEYLEKIYKVTSVECV